MDILVHVKAHEMRSEPVGVATRLAKDLGARLTGLHTLRDMAALRNMFGDGAAIVTQRQAEWDSKTEAAKSRFLADLRTQQLDGTWLQGEGQASEMLSFMGRLYDLVVVEQTGAGDPIDWDPVEETALGSGAPTLVVPSAGNFPRVGERVVIAWNHSREASLAVRGAMPILVRAKEVVVLSGQRRESFSSITHWPPHDLAESLRCKGVAARAARLVIEGVTDGAGLLKAAHAHSADLLVMGAYGRSWMREWLLGGATRHVLRHMDLPVLVAH